MLDRAWALATAARGRALVAAGRGDLEQALGHLEAALDEHKRLGYPLSRIHRKLGVHSRAELATLLARQPLKT